MITPGSKSNDVTDEDVERSFDRIYELQAEMKKKSKTIHKSRLSLDDIPFIDAMARDADMEQDHTEEILKYNALKSRLDGTECTWDESPAKREYMVRRELLKTKSGILHKKSSSLSSTVHDQASINRKAFAQLYINAKIGADLSKHQYAGGRGDIQKSFKSDLLKFYDVEPIKGAEDYPGSGCYWDVMTGEYLSSDGFIAAHLFPYRSGQTVMEAIFGNDAAEELFSAQNGLMLPTWMESSLDIGYIVIVPDVSVSPTSAEMEVWQLSEPKEYKLKVLHQNDEGETILNIATKSSPGKKVTTSPTYRHIEELDGKRLTWRNQNRPRARYLYFLYLMNVVKFIHLNRAAGSGDKVLPSEYNKPYWGTLGKYVKTGMIRGLVEEIGHEIRPFVEADNAPKTDEPADTTLAATAALMAIALADTGSIDKARRNDVKDFQYLDEHSDSDEDGDEESEGDIWRG